MWYYLGIFWKSKYLQRRCGLWNDFVEPIAIGPGRIGCQFLVEQNATGIAFHHIFVWGPCFWLCTRCLHLSSISFSVASSFSHNSSRTTQTIFHKIWIHNLTHTPQPTTQITMNFFHTTCQMTNLLTDFNSNTADFWQLWLSHNPFLNTTLTCHNISPLFYTRSPLTTIILTHTSSHKTALISPKKTNQLIFNPDTIPHNCQTSSILTQLTTQLAWTHERTFALQAQLLVHMDVHLSGNCGNFSVWGLLARAWEPLRPGCFSCRCLFVAPVGLLCLPFVFSVLCCFHNEFSDTLCRSMYTYNKN